MALYKGEMNTCNTDSRITSIWFCFAHFALTKEDTEQYFNASSNFYVFNNKLLPNLVRSNLFIAQV